MTEGKKKSSISISVKILIGVIVLGAISVGVWMLNRPAPYEKQAGTYQSQRAETKEGLLPDSSRFWLNSATALEYIDKDGRNRVVRLNGEAYISAKPEIGRQMKIETRGLIITLYGGDINVEAYEDRETVVVTLKSGQAVVDYIGASLWTVDANWQLAFNYKTKTGEIRYLGKEGADMRVAWRIDQSHFSMFDMTLDDMLKYLERNLNVEIESSVRFSADLYNVSLPRTLSLEQILIQLSQLDTPFSITLEGRKAVLYSRSH